MFKNYCMFKNYYNIYHTHNLHRSPFGCSFFLDIYFCPRMREYISQNKNSTKFLEIHSNKILDNISIRSTLYNTFCEESHNILNFGKPEIVNLDSFKRLKYIYGDNYFKEINKFPNNNFYATYKYTYPLKNFQPETLISIHANTRYEPLTFVIKSSNIYQKNNGDYKFTIS